MAALWIDSAKANVTVARATLSTDDTNLSKASIRSPIDGVVLSRSVEPEKGRGRVAAGRHPVLAR